MGHRFAGPAPTAGFSRGSGRACAFELEALVQSELWFLLFLLDRQSSVSLCVTSVCCSCCFIPAMLIHTINQTTKPGRESRCVKTRRLRRVLPRRGLPGGGHGQKRSGQPLPGRRETSKRRTGWKRQGLDGKGGGHKRERRDRANWEFFGILLCLQKTHRRLIVLWVFVGGCLAGGKEL